MTIIEAIRDLEALFKSTISLTSYAYSNSYNSIKSFKQKVGYYKKGYKVKNNGITLNPKTTVALIYKIDNDFIDYGTPYIIINEIHEVYAYGYS